MSIKLKKATVADIPKLLEIEKTAAGMKTYSAMLEEKEWVEDLEKESVFLIENDGVIIGNTSYQDKGDGHFYIGGLIIMPQFQGRGFGREAMASRD